MLRPKPWTERQARMFARAEAIIDDRRPGHWLPIVRSLAVQGLPEAQCFLGNVHSDDRRPGLYNGARALFWYRRAVLQGDPLAMYNLAITYRNLGDMGRYRHWLARAAMFDDNDRAELQRFRTRSPHSVMRRWRRYAEER